MININIYDKIKSIKNKELYFKKMNTLKIAKGLAVAYAGFFTVFAVLSGATSTNGLDGILQNLPNVLPWLLVWLVVWISWKNPKVGGVIFLILAIGATLFFHTYLEMITFTVITTPLLVISGLFLVGQKLD